VNALCGRTTPSLNVALLGRSGRRQCVTNEIPGKLALVDEWLKTVHLGLPPGARHGFGTGRPHAEQLNTRR
jgi:hypothetical protein